MKRIAIAISAAMAVSGFALSAHAADPNAPVGAPAAQTDNQLDRARDNTRDATNNAGAAVNNGAAAARDKTETTGDKVRNSLDQATAGTPTANNPAPDAKDIRSSIASLTNEAMTKGDLNHIVNRFVDADRNRIKNSDTYSQDYGQKLDGRIEQINETWKQKYGHTFDMKHANDVLTDQFASIQQGQIGRDAALASEVIHNSERANLSNKDNAAGNDKGDENLEPGRGIAVVTVNSSHGLPDLRVPMIHEMPDQWKVNVPDSLTADKLRQNLLDHLTALGDSSSQWPSDENEAYRMAAHHVLMAVLDQPVQSHTGGTMNEGTTGGMAK
ncbi:MAG TPA: hypothetical protein VLI90_06340 [Tepidisphaeraceae bacterium]|nr:hypothetical protein [Tepidisphaeraceae bacterium]